MKLFLILFTLILFGLTDKTPNHILIGDSQTPSIAFHSKYARVESSLQKGGWRVVDLINALKTYNTAPNIENVFVCIGTNGVFSKTDSVELLCKLLKEKFPVAKLYVIPGSFGWSWKGPYTPPQNMQQKVDEYYKRFENNGVFKLKNGIGLSSVHPNQNTPSMKLIAAEIDSLITLEK